MGLRALSTALMAAVSGLALAAEPVAAPGSVPAAAAAPRPAPPGPVYGVNLAGAEFGDLPGEVGKSYIYPGAAQFDYLRRKGLLVARVPFLWERLQPALSGPLDAAELARLDAVVALARARGVGVILDPHNYARYRGKRIGSPEVPNAAFADFWKRLAEHYRAEPAIFAYGLMNEPHDMKGLWPAAAQAGIDGVRAADAVHTILVPGDSWSGAWTWPKANANLAVRDPAGNFMYEAHQYFDRDGSGTYKKTYDQDGATPTIGVERVKPFIEWLQERKARGFLGEYGVPDNDPRWLVVLERFLSVLKENGIGGTYWAAGPWWGNYPLSVEPRNGQDRPQMAVLLKFSAPAAGD